MFNTKSLPIITPGLLWVAALMIVSCTSDEPHWPEITNVNKLMTLIGIVILMVGLIGVQPVLAQKGADNTVLLWPDGAPGAKGSSELDKPALSIFLPEKSKRTGTGVVVFPGGGYSHLAMEKEGYKVAEWLNSLGVTAFVVKYRLGMRYHHPAQLQDAQRAIRLVRSNAQEWGIHPDRLGVMGFSAGGHLASTAGTHFKQADVSTKNHVDRLSSIPDFMILIYPVITMQMDYTHQGSRNHLLGENPDPDLVTFLSNDLQITSQTPPTFIIHGSNDRSVPVENSIQFYTGLKEHNIPAEMHLFENGAHGFGLAANDPVLSQWTSLCAAWLMSRGLLSD